MPDKELAKDSAKDDGPFGFGSFGVDRGKLVHVFEKAVDQGFSLGEKKVESVFDTKVDSMLASPGITGAQRIQLTSDRAEIDRDLKAAMTSLKNTLIGVINGDALDVQIRGKKVDDATDYDLSSSQQTTTPAPSAKFDYSLTKITAKFDLKYLAQMPIKSFDLKEAVKELDWKPQVSFTFTDGALSIETSGGLDWELYGPNANKLGYDVEFWIKLHW